MIAMAVAGDPSLVVADEPTTALDVTVQAQILQLLRKLRDELGCAFLVVTHDLGVAAQVADRIAVCYAGRLAETGGRRGRARPIRRTRTRRPCCDRGSRSAPRACDTAARRCPASLPISRDQPPGCAFAPRCKFRIDDCPRRCRPLEAVEARRPASGVHPRR